MILHNKCDTQVSFNQVTNGYYAQCPKCDEDLYSFETEVIHVHQSR